MEKRIRVVAAIIKQDNKIFCAQRAYGFLKGKWEFPGGKIEEGETPEEAIKREIKEELDTEIEVDSFLMNEVYEYPEFILDMDCFMCHVKSGRLQVEEGIHLAECWCDVDKLNELKWCPADKEIVERFKSFL